MRARLVLWSEMPSLWSRAQKHLRDLNPVLAAPAREKGFCSPHVTKLVHQAVVEEKSASYQARLAHETAGAGRSSSVGGLRGYPKGYSVIERKGFRIDSDESYLRPV